MLREKDSTYELIVVQQPSTAAEFGNHSVSRISLAPPLMVQLIVRNGSGASIPADDELPFLIAHVTLHKASLPDGTSDPQPAGITGTTTANPFNLQDLNNQRGIFFVFPDIGIQLQGTWRLLINLMRIAQYNILTCVWTEPFDVAPVEGYVAPKVTELTRHFQKQGVRMFLSNSVVPH
ncbi:hypothetical protein M422DRAFT_151350 [Sphaerobolus stellatus SS14]|nr:hypothetical protein M422DRAFT_151350 [Sphaerobolus stellatus SS14]